MHFARLGTVSAIAIFLATPGMADDSTPAEDFRTRMLERLDTDGDGTLSEAERDAGRAGRKEARKSRIDTDGDGSVSDSEREAGRAAREERRQAAVTKHDSDGDGRLDRSERKAARAAGGGQPGGGRGRGGSRRGGSGGRR